MILKLKHYDYFLNIYCAENENKNELDFINHSIKKYEQQQINLPEFNIEEFTKKRMEEIRIASFKNVGNKNEPYFKDLKLIAEQIFDINKERFLLEKDESILFYEEQRKIKEQKINQTLNFLKVKKRLLEPIEKDKAENIIFINNFNNIEINKVNNYFKEKLIDKNYLEEETLNNYLKLAFDLQKLPKEKFNFKVLKSKQTTISIFYNFYKIISGKPQGKKNEYVKLLTDYFNGFEYQKVYNNFDK